MNAIILPDYNTNIIRAMKSLQVNELDIPKPTNGEVLVKVEAAPCNPSDIAFMRGGYNIRKPVPAVMGFECTGTVVETGPAPAAINLLGKRVSCFARETDSGTWADYFLTAHDNCLLIRDELSTEQAATLCINPFTAYALFEQVVKKKANAIIQNGASGQVGLYIRKLAHHNGVKVINLVRKDEHLHLLIKAGERYILNINDPGFENNLHQIAYNLHATIAFDAVGGDTSGLILNAMPADSDLIIYGGLSGKPVGQINTLDIIFRGKTIRGFSLGEWKIKAGDIRFREISGQIQALMMQGVMAVRIQGSFSLHDVQKAMEQYIRNMSAGKILFRP